MGLWEEDAACSHTPRLCFSLLQLEKPPEKEEEHAPEFIKVRENLRRIAALSTEERVL